MKTTIQQTLAKNVHRARVEHGLSKVDFCLIANISRPSLDAIEDGEGNIKLDTLCRLADALQKQPWELLK